MKKKKHETSNCLNKEEMSGKNGNLDYLLRKVIMLRHLPGKHRQLQDTAGRSLIAEKHKFRRMPSYCARVIKNCSRLNAS